MTPMNSTTNANETLAWVCAGREAWIPFSQLAVSLQDVGFRQGVVAVERLRTYSGQAFELAAHLVRWRRTLEHLQIRTDTTDTRLDGLIRSLIDRNQEWCREVGDFGITLLATPGRIDDPVGGPSEWLHLNALPADLIAKRRTYGQPLLITDVQQPSPRCWPRDIKVRCRLHYYSADAFARQLAPDALGVLVDADGSITDTSIANLALFQDGRILAPPIEQVLPGVTQQVVRELAERIGLAWQHQTLLPADLRTADEVWLMGTDGGLWFADRVDGAPIGGGVAGPIYRRLLAEWDRYVGADPIAVNRK